MFLRKRPTYVSNASLTLTAAASTAFPAQQVKVPIDRTWPIEEIIVVVHATVDTALTVQQGYGLLNLLKKVNLSVNDGVQPRSVVDVSGAALLQFAVNEGLNLDRSTLGIVQAWCANHGSSGTNTGSIPAGAILRIAYRIPLVHPALVGTLRIRSMLPVHLHPQDPILTLDFAASSEIGTFASSYGFTSCVAEVILCKRDMPLELADQISKATNGNPVNWFIPSDLIESVYPLNTGTAVEYRLSIPTPGQYTGVLISQMKYDATLGTRPVDMSADATYATATRWRLEAGQSTIREWRARHLQIENDYSRTANAPAVLNPWGLALANAATGLDLSTGLTGAGTVVFSASKSLLTPGNFGGALASGCFVQAPASGYLDFLTDGVTDANELGSLLDCNLPARSGLKMEIVSTLTPGATAGSFVSILGRRLYGDLSAYQRISQL